MPRRTLSDGDTFELEGAECRVRFEYDDSHGAPWDECDGHGPVSEWAQRDKRPGELVLCQDRRSKRYYDQQEATVIAKRDGWGLGREEATKLTVQLGRAPTRNEIVAEAVRRDFEFLRSWCNDDWHYVGVVVELLDEDGEPTKHHDSLWGIESNAGDYLCTVAHELAEGLLRYVPREVMP